MPEGPEIHRSADRLRRLLLAAALDEVEFAFPHLRDFAETLKGRRVRAVEARGKAILTFFDNDLVLYTHNQLYGRWQIWRRGGLPQSSRSLRVLLRNAKGAALLYSASEIALLSEAELAQHPYLLRLGPDPLHPQVDADGLLQRYREGRFGRRRLGALLLDQGFIAGIGNYLRSEILHVSGLHPQLRPSDCSEVQLRLLAENTSKLSIQSYAHAGITNDLERVASLKALGLPRRQFRHHVFARAGQPCYGCAQAIERIVDQGRRLYLCPRCQVFSG